MASLAVKFLSVIDANILIKGYFCPPYGRHRRKR